MPAVSKAQKRFFGAMLGNPKERAKRGISKETAEDFARGHDTGLPERVEDRHPAVVARHRDRHR